MSDQKFLDIKFIHKIHDGILQVVGKSTHGLKYIRISYDSHFRFYWISRITDSRNRYGDHQRNKGESFRLPEDAIEYAKKFGFKMEEIK